MPNPKRKISDVLTDVQEVVKDAPPSKHTAAADVPEERLAPVSWRVPETLLGEFVEYAASRKAKRQKPWKHQDLFAEALREYLDLHAKK